MTKSILLSVEIRYEEDVVATRQRARQVAMLLGFSPQDQTSLATAVSEIARNAYRYAGGGKAEFGVENTTTGQQMVVRIRDAGKGIEDIRQVLDGQYRSQTGMGLGIIGSKRLADTFDVTTGPSGTTITLGKRLPTGPIGPPQLAKVGAELAQWRAQSAAAEFLQQNRELLVAMEDLQQRQAEVERLNAELAETNRGVLALYAELDDTNASLRAASASKSRFLSDMSHELRTPLNAMISISGLLLDRIDGDLSGEQEKQVGLIRKSAESLREMVNDLLDLAKIESGKIDVHPTEFAASDLLIALRGMFRPLFGSGGVAFTVEDGPHLTLFGDEQKISQILRNFVSNALKFTERGEVRVTLIDNGDGTVTFKVADTGLGIAREDAQRIFQDYEQVDSAVQRRVRGTGLGLPLSRKLAKLLGGEVSMASELGEGSTFALTLPARFTLPIPGASAQSLEKETAPHG